MRKLAIPLALAAVVWMACSTADAGWTYYGSVRVVTPAPVIYSYPVVTPTYTYVYPTYTYPVYSSPVIVAPRVHIHRRGLRRTVWTVW